MPYHLSPNKLSVLDANGHVVPGGTHKNTQDALAHLQALNINTRREEGKPVAPKIKKIGPDEKAGQDHLFTKQELQARGKQVLSQLPDDKKASWLSDPTDDELYQWLVNEGMEEYAPHFFKQQNYNLGNGIDRASYHPVDERFGFQPAPDWNNDAAISLPEELWVLAHPYGDEKNQDAHEEHFDKATNFYEKENLLPQVPVSYYHNFNPDGTPMGEPIAIGKTTARKYLRQGRADKVRFDKDIPEEIKSRLAKAYRNGTLRASPTVVPDFHKVDNQTGHIDNWLTGSIAVFDAEGDRQPANARAIGLPAMKALFKQAHLQFPKHLEVKMGKTTKAAPTWKARVLKAFMKALGEMPEEETKEEEEKALSTQGQNLEDDASERARFEGANTANEEKDVQPLPELGEELEHLGDKVEGANALEEPDVKLDWKPEQKRMKAIIGAQANQLKALQTRADLGDFNTWVSQQLVAGKVIPAEVEDLKIDFLQALSDDRASHPVMKAKDGQTVSRVERLKASIERRASRFGEMDLTGEQMKALGLQMGSLNFDQTKSEKPFNEQRRAELLNASPLGEKILKDSKK